MNGLLGWRVWFSRTEKKSGEKYTRRVPTEEDQAAIRQRSVQKKLVRGQEKNGHKTKVHNF